MFCALITYVCYWIGFCLFVCFVSSVFRLFVCKTLVFDPGVSGTVVGFPVSLWSCVLLVLRLAVSVPCCFSGVAACCSRFGLLLALLG